MSTTRKIDRQPHPRKGRILGLSSALLLSTAGLLVAQVPNPQLAALPDGQWSALPSSAMTSVGAMDIACCDYSIGCELPGIFSYSGATLDTDRRRIVLWGGGHNDYFGNQLLAFDLNDLSWDLVTPPTSVCQFSTTPGYRYLNGDPVSRHTYDHLDYIEHLGLFFAYSGATADAPPFNNGSSYGDLWTFDFESAAWTDRTALQSGDIDYWLSQPGASGEYDPQADLWFQLSAQGIWSLDFSNHAWSLVNDDGPPGIERVSVLDPTRRWIWSYGGDYGGDDNLSAYDIDRNQFRIVSAENLPGNTSGAGLAYDAVNDQLVLFGGSASGSVFNYDIEGATWTEYAPSGGPNGSPVYGRVLYDEVNNVFFLIDSVERVWVWKNTLGNSSSIFSDGFESGDLEGWDGSSS
ncbi:MAG: hypothetical protein AAF604_07550 [Acidobacteriota bacterium]